MRKIQEDIWNEYTKYKSSNKKINAIKRLKLNSSIADLEKLSEEFIQNRSSNFRHEAINVIEYLEQVHYNKIETLQKYQSLLKKYKIPNFSNYWFRKHKITTKENWDIELRNSFASKEIRKRQKLNLRFQLTENIYGIIQTQLVTPFNLTYGFICNYRDIGNGWINNFPNDQKHYNKLINEKKIEVDEDLINRMKSYFEFIQTLEKNLLKIDRNTNPLETEIYINFNKHLDFNKELWFFLGLINISCSLKRKAEVNYFAKMGRQSQSPKKAGSGWIEYYNSKINTVSNTI